MMKSLADLIEERKKRGGGRRRPAHEWQAFAYRLAAELEDVENLKMYLRLVKTQDRGLLEKCRRFALDSEVRPKKALFLWKLKESRSERKRKDAL